MDIDDVDPLLRPTARLLNLKPSRALYRRAGRVGPRALPRPRIRGMELDVVRVGEVTLRIHKPRSKKARPGLLWLHGGGLVTGAARQDDWFCAITAAQLDAVVVSVEYRLAPENPYPAAIDDAFSAWTWMMNHTQSLGIDKSHVAIGGESAGGGLAACLVQRVHDHGGDQPVAQWLFAPMLDDRTAEDRELDSIDHVVWNNSSNRWAWGVYLRGVSQRARADLPYAAAARRNDLSGLPPTWIYASDIELFHGEVRAYSERLEQCGVPVEMVTVHAAPHAFELCQPWSLPARQLLSRAREWLRGELS